MGRIATPSVTRTAQRGEQAAGRREKVQGKVASKGELRCPGGGMEVRETGAVQGESEVRGSDEVPYTVSWKSEGLHAPYLIFKFLSDAFEFDQSAASDHLMIE